MGEECHYVHAGYEDLHYYLVSYLYKTDREKATGFPQVFLLFSRFSCSLSSAVLSVLPSYLFSQFSRPITSHLHYKLCMSCTQWKRKINFNVREMPLLEILSSRKIVLSLLSGRSPEPLKSTRERMVRFVL